MDSAGQKPRYPRGLAKLFMKMGAFMKEIGKMASIMEMENLGIR